MMSSFVPMETGYPGLSKLCGVWTALPVEETRVLISSERENTYCTNHKRKSKSGSLSRFVALLSEQTIILLRQVM